jgi:WD40 repeat protein
VVAATRPVPGATGDGQDDPLSVAATFIDPATGAVRAEVSLGDTVPGTPFGSSVSVSPDGRMVAVTSGLATTVLDARTQRVLARIALPPVGGRGADGSLLPAEFVTSTGWTADGTGLVIGAGGHMLPGVSDGDIVLVDTRSWRVVNRTQPVGAPVPSPRLIEPSPDGRVLAVVEVEPAEIHERDAQSLRQIRTVPVRSGEARDMSFSPDGRLLAVVDDQGSLSLLDTATWRWAGEPVRLHHAAVLQVEWLSDGRTVATAGADGTVVLFDSDRRQVRAGALPITGTAVAGPAYLVPGIRDELTVLGGERPGRRYPMAPTAWLSLVCAVVSRDLTRAEWAHYLPGRPYARTCTAAR